MGAHQVFHTLYSSQTRRMTCIWGWAAGKSGWELSFWGLPPHCRIGLIFRILGTALTSNLRFLRWRTPIPKENPQTLEGFTQGTAEGASRHLRGGAARPRGVGRGVAGGGYPDIDINGELEGGGA